MSVVESKLDSVDKLALLYLECARELGVDAVMGHSLGGLVAIRMGLIDPKVASHIVAISPLLGLNISPLTALTHAIMSKLQGDSQLPYILDEEVNSPSHKKSSPTEYLSEHFDSTMRTLQEVRGLAGRVRCNIDLIVAKHEHLVDNAAIIEFAKNAPHTRICTVNNSHFYGKSHQFVNSVMYFLTSRAQ